MNIKKPIISYVIIGIVVSSSIIGGFFLIKNLTQNNNTVIQQQIPLSINSSFATFNLQGLNYTPSIIPTNIKNGLSNVNLQGLDEELTPEIIENLEENGFALVDKGIEDIYEPVDFDMNTETPMYVTTDLCLHSLHSLFDIYLRILEYYYFNENFTTMISALRENQISMYKASSIDQSLKPILEKNIAYLTVILRLLDNQTSIPNYVKDTVESELGKINAGLPAYSSIFGYLEDFSQYKPRGHYTRNEELKQYFQAMMYAGRMGFLLNDTIVKEGTALQQTRMAILLTLSLNDTIGEKQIWDYWKAIYEPTVFYVGKSDDLTPEEYYQIWKEIGSPALDKLADNTTVQSFIERAQEYRPPKINSMFVSDVFNYTSATKGFRLMGQRFIPDSFIFQQLVHTNVANRLMPTGLDVMSIFGSARADYFMENESKIYPDYDDQVAKLREWFGDLTEYDWTQNLYWLWLYSLFQYGILLFRPILYRMYRTLHHGAKPFLL